MDTTKGGAKLAEKEIRLKERLVELRWSKELFLREILQRATLCFPSGDLCFSDSQYEEACKMWAKNSMAGGSGVELINGDSLVLNNKHILSYLKEERTALSHRSNLNKRFAAISIIGRQGSGKSTLWVKIRHLFSYLLIFCYSRIICFLFDLTLNQRGVQWAAILQRL